MNTSSLKTIVLIALISFQVALSLFTIDTFSAENNVVREAILLELNLNIDGGAVSFVESIVKSNPGRVYVLEIDSYGGYLSAADRIVYTIENSGSYCVAWIPPSGYAVSAAALIALSCKEVYMAQGAVIGGMKPSPEDPKTIEYVKARARSMLEKQGKKNLTWIVDELVDKAKSYSSDEATSIGLAKSASDLSSVLEAENLALTSRVAPSLWDKLLSVISHPLVSELLLFAGVLLILVEIFTTGFQGYGLAGALMIVFALYGLTLLPVEILNLALIIAGAVLIIVELFTPGFGVFGLSGIILSIIGFVLTFMNIPSETLTGLIYVVVGGLSSVTGLLVFIGYKAAKAMKMRRASIREQLIGSIGYAKTEISETFPGTVYVLNEDWTAYSVKGRIPIGSKVRVVKVEGLKLYVEKIEE
ncbi:MAG: NfeD family protein [Desulfurococcaceae archaeon]